MTRPSPSDLLAETARLAFHFHWPLDTLLDLEHRDRRAFLAHAEALASGVAPARQELVAPVPAAAPAAAAPDIASIGDPGVRGLFATYFGGAA